MTRYAIERDVQGVPIRLVWLGDRRPQVPDRDRTAREARPAQKPRLKASSEATRPILWQPSFWEAR